MANKCKVHQYKRIKQKPSGREIYRCMNCAHYITPEFLLGRQSICWGCKQEFTIDYYATERTFPKCENCRDRVTSFTKKSQEESPGPQIELAEDSLESISVVADILKRYGL